MLDAHHTPEVMVAWQGGEPTMMGLDFFKRSIELVDKHRKPWQQVSYTIQTNGVLIDERWAAFFKEHNFLVGLSVDGPRELHDKYRVDKRGEGSFDRVMAGYGHLQDAGVDVNVLCTVHAGNQDHALDKKVSPICVRATLCASYKSFFGHVDKPMRAMSTLLHAGRAPSEAPALLANPADGVATS